MNKEELQEQIKDYNQKIDQINENIKNLELIKKEYISSRFNVAEQLNKIEAEEWTKDALNGKHRICLYKEIPKNIFNDWAAIKYKYTHGCTGDPYDGCRGCEKYCDRRAQDEFMKKYKIKEIKY